MEDSTEHLHSLREVHSNIEAVILTLTPHTLSLQPHFTHWMQTKQVVDELGSLVSQQGSHLDTLENNTASTKQFTRYYTPSFYCDHTLTLADKQM